MTPPLILRLAGNTQAYLKVQHDGINDAHDVRRFTYNYGNEVAPLIDPSYIWGYWKFEEVSGTRYDETTNDIDLTDANPETTSQGTGILGNCVIGSIPPGGNQGWLEWDAVSPEEVPEETPWSFTFWHKWTEDDPTPGDPLQIYFPPYDTCFAIYTLTSPTTAWIYFDYDAGDENIHMDLDPYTYDYNNWHMWTITFDGTYARVYMDAVLKWTSDAYVPWGWPNIEWDHVRFMPGVGEDCTSYIDDAIMFKNLCLSADQITWMYNSGAGRTIEL